MTMARILAAMVVDLGQALLVCSPPPDALGEPVSSGDGPGQT